MPSNPFRDELDMRKKVDSIISKIDKEGIDLNRFIHQISLMFPVSEKKIEKFILSYETNGYVEIKDGIVFQK